MDGRNNNFSGGRKYTNGEITVYWKPDACVHASYCYRELIEVFDPGRRPWVDMSGSNTDRIIEVVNMCPTEALSWKWNDDEKNKNISFDQTNHIVFRRPELLELKETEEGVKPISVKVMPDGPIVIKGDFTFSFNGTTRNVKDGILSICRCGASDHMPFCDGVHRKIGYEDK